MAETDEVALANAQKQLEKLIMAKYGEGSGNPVATILILGECGDGKSSIINTLSKAILGDYYELTHVGKGEGTTKTLVLRQLKNMGIEPYMLKLSEDNKNCMIVKDEFFSLLPNVIDFAGFSNQMRDEYQEILRLLILGYIPLGTSIECILAKQEKVGIGKLRCIFKKADPNWRVTHILYVQSCLTAPCDETARCISKVLKEPLQNTGKLTFNGKVHIMMTMYDRVNENALTAKKPADTDKDDKTADPKETFEKTEEKIAHVFDHVGNEKHSITRWINVCDKVGHDNIQVDIRSLQFLFELLKHPDPEMTPDVELDKAGWGWWCTIT